MSILLVYAHPSKASFNHALKEVAKDSVKDLCISDLYKMNFKAAADWSDFQPGEYSSQYTAAQKEAFLKDSFSRDLQEEQKKLISCKAVIFQFPLWWFGPPAILKGWLDRVLAKGFAYDKEKMFDRGLMRGKSAMISLTTQSPESSYTQEGVHGPIEVFLKPLHHTLRFAGFSIEEPFIAYGVDGSSLSTRKTYLERYHQRCRQLMPTSA